VIEVLRRLDARTRPREIVVFNGPGVSVEASALELFRERWQSSLGVAIRTVASDGSDPARALAAAIDGGLDALVLNPGRAELTSALPDALLCAFVGFSYPGTPAARFDHGPLEDIAGRGLDGYRWAIKYLLSCAEWPLTICRYGEERDQVGELRLPEGPGPHPLIVLIHGGGWKALWRKDIMAPMAVDLARRGYATWNIEFRRLGAGGGWPMTFDDVAAAINSVEELRQRFPLDESRLLLVGHSSGGQLALWAAAAEEVRIRAVAVVGLAALVDLVEGSRRELIGGENVIAKLLGGTVDEVPARFAALSPRALLPLGTRQTLVQGLSDYIHDLIDQNRAYAREAAGLGDQVSLVEIDGAEHLDLIEPSSAGWPLVAAQIEQSLAGAGGAQQGRV